MEGYPLNDTPYTYVNDPVNEYMTFDAGSRMIEQLNYNVPSDIKDITDSGNTPVPKNIVSELGNELYMNLQGSFTETLDIPTVEELDARDQKETDEKILHKELLLPKTITEYTCSISGRIDAHLNNTLYEYKMSTNEGRHKPWLLQVILYCMIGIQPFARGVGGHYKEPAHESFRTVEIYNFITGKKYNIAIDFNKLATYKTVLFEEILTKFNYPTKLKNKFLNNIESKLFI